jgi:CRISPR-associated protein Csc1
MVMVYRCVLELQDSLYYATREIGRLYETEPVLHNYSLCYALGLVDNAVYATNVAEEHSYRYFSPEQVPKYKEHLIPLNRESIYITPAKAIRHSAVLHTWKYANNNYHVEMEKTQKNIPSFGRAKEIAPESVFECFIISKKSLTLPKWIRLGKWMSKAEVRIEVLTPKLNSEKVFNCAHPLNPLDVIFTNQVLSYDTINMPPVSLIRNVQMRGEFYTFAEIKDLMIPARMSYRFSS